MSDPSEVSAQSDSIVPSDVSAPSGAGAPNKRWKVMLRKTAAILLMVLTIAGMVLCAAGIYGAWAVNGPVTDAITSVLGLVSTYTGMAVQTTETVTDAVGDVTTRLAEIEQTAASTRAEVRARLTARVDELGQPVARLSALARTAATGAEALNGTLDGMSRVPRLGVVGSDANLEGLSARLDNVATQLDALRASAAGGQIVGTPVQDAARNLAGELQLVESQLTTWSTRLAETQARLDTAQSRAPLLIDLVSLLGTGFFALFGAGQASLFRNAWGWFRRS
jgi:hypothetical protein